MDAGDAARERQHSADWRNCPAGKKDHAGNLLFEGVGAALLTLRFQEQMGWGKAVYYGIFHSISAFCNAGFDLMGKDAPYTSFTGYYDDPLVNIVIMALIIIGGIGFFVWNDVSTTATILADTVFIPRLCW